MTEKQWYEDIPRDEFEGKHVKAVMDSGAVVKGRLSLWIGDRVTICFVGSDEGITVLFSKDGSFRLTEGVKSLDLVWDERDWTRIEVKDLRDGDAVVANGVLYKVRAMGLQDEHPFVLADAPGRLSIDLRLVSCALRRKMKVPVKPGFYKDTLGEFWARAAKSTDDGTWRSVEPDALDQPAKSDKYMANLMPLTPVHFESGRAA
ncbi:MAG: hypothetical protein M3Z49_06030 [Bifidobacteriales bacterium]|nr:hypothetical protein [Bifidobacteriales bacterium]MCT6918750.1 hypothetical protein [Bifidobacteriales bacterium]